MPALNVDLALQSKREEVIGTTKYLIATLGTLVGWKSPSALNTDFGATMLFTAILVFVAALRGRLIWNHSFWPEAIGDLAELAGLLASVALLLLLYRPIGWLAFGAWVFCFLLIAYRWLRTLHLNYFTHTQADADDSV